MKIIREPREAIKKGFLETFFLKRVGPKLKTTTDKTKNPNQKWKLAQSAKKVVLNAGKAMRTTGTKKQCTKHKEERTIPILSKSIFEFIYHAS